MPILPFAVALAAYAVAAWPERAGPKALRWALAAGLLVPRPSPAPDMRGARALHQTRSRRAGPYALAVDETPTVDFYAGATVRRSSIPWRNTTRCGADPRPRTLIALVKDGRYGFDDPARQRLGFVRAVVELETPTIAIRSGSRRNSSATPRSPSAARDLSTLCMRHSFDLERLER